MPPEPSPAADVTPPAPDEPAAIDPPATDVVVPAPVVETEPAEPDGGDTAERAAFPWESGAPPLVVDLVRQGRFVEAYWVTAASDESPTRAEVLRLAAAAFDSVDSLGAGDVQVRWTPPEDTVGGDHEASLVAAAAILRCGLSAGYSSHYLAVDAVCTNLPVEWANLLRSASTAVQLNTGSTATQTPTCRARTRCGNAPSWSGSCAGFATSCPCAGSSIIARRRCSGGSSSRGSRWVPCWRRSSPGPVARVTWRRSGRVSSGSRATAACR